VLQEPPVTTSILLGLISELTWFSDLHDVISIMKGLSNSDVLVQTLISSIWLIYGLSCLRWAVMVELHADQLDFDNMLAADPVSQAIIVPVEV
jgi:hypothetical protein